MTSIGTGYDLSASTYSPDGRIFQVEYAGKAVDAGGTAIGIRTKDGVILAVEKLVHSKLLVPGTNRRIQTIDPHIGLATAGLFADAKHVASRARDEAQNYRDIYCAPTTLKDLVSRVSLYLQVYTLYSSVRPFGVSSIFGSVDKNGPQLYMIEPSGLSFGHRATAVGKGKLLAKTELEKLDFDTLESRDAVMHAARIIHKCHADEKDKQFELEITWICPESKGRHQFVPADLLEQAEVAAKNALEEEMEE
ncbi:20s proteasome subunit [Phaffia rhodozyma]|uniref:Proteasome subunit alpha type n=1 Tax=Phaffia rhodozyma TaxID=264483 RepID=A0A0F7SED7_PHARH|nr:20s proteasome subunit [Phaffia rhodozyma]